MKLMYVRSFGTGLNGNSVYEWTADRTSASLYCKTQAETDCDLLGRRAPERVIPENATERLVFENFRVEEVVEGGFGIAFESSTEAEWLASPRRS